MVDLEDIKRAAAIETDAQGHAVVRIPRELWDELLMQRIGSPDEGAYSDPDQDDIDEWWDEF
ncbi:MAG: hypothetical protein IT324_12425 [Anaerolineae bacterium]|nr:hypothetical protein [Anaerolineae bacterium]